MSKQLACGNRCGYQTTEDGFHACDCKEFHLACSGHGPSIGPNIWSSAPGRAWPEREMDVNDSCPKCGGGRLVFV